MNHHRDGWPQYYILIGKTPFATDMETWARSLEQRHTETHRTGTDPWRVKRTEITENCFVSTVFIGLDHNWGRGDPILFETMIFGGPLNQDGWRYATWDEAERGHEAAVVEARKACAQVDAIAKNAGAT